MCFRHLEYLVANLYSLRPFGIFVAIWYIFYENLATLVSVE
jgi:hypothetical protein